MSLPEKPRVSVCFPAYNCAGTIEETLTSIMSQAYQPFEVIVLNNCSTDNTGEVIQYLQQKYQIKYFVNDRLLPPEENYDKAMRLGSGDMVCVYHTDDVYDPSIIEKCVAAFKRDGRIGAVFTMASVIDEHGARIGSYHLPSELSRLEKLSYDFNDIFDPLLKHTNSFLICSSAMIRKDVIDGCQGFNYQRFRSAGDLNFWLEILASFNIFIINEPLVSYRISSSQVTQGAIRERLDPWDYFLVMDQYCANIENHKNRHFYTITRIKDLTIRSLNHTALQHPEKSNKLIEQSFILYFNNIKKLFFSKTVLGCLLIQLGLYLVNMIPSRYLKVFYRKRIWELVNLKKRLISF